MKQVYQYMAIFCNFYTTLNHLHPLQVENCDSNSRLVVDENDNGKFRLERVKNTAAFVSWAVNPISAEIYLYQPKKQRVLFNLKSS